MKTAITTIFICFFFDLCTKAQDYLLKFRLPTDESYRIIIDETNEYNANNIVSIPYSNSKEVSIKILRGISSPYHKDSLFVKVYSGKIPLTLPGELLFRLRGENLQLINVQPFD